MKTPTPFELHQRVRLNADGRATRRADLHERVGTVTRPPRQGNKKTYVCWDGTRAEAAMCTGELEPVADAAAWVGSDI